MAAGLAAERASSTAGSAKRPRPGWGAGRRFDVADAARASRSSDHQPRRQAVEYFIRNAEGGRDGAGARVRTLSCPSRTSTPGYAMIWNSTQRSPAAGWTRWWPAEGARPCPCRPAHALPQPRADRLADHAGQGDGQRVAAGAPRGRSPRSNDGKINGAVGTTTRTSLLPRDRLARVRPALHRRARWCSIPTRPIEPHDNVAEIGDATRRATHLIDLPRHLGLHFAGLLRQSLKEGESVPAPCRTGQPDDFENAEGNLGWHTPFSAISAARLPISAGARPDRFDRAARPGHRIRPHPCGPGFVAKGLDKLTVGAERLDADLDGFGKCGRGVQTVMRRQACKPIRTLKALTPAGHQAGSMRAFVNRGTARRRPA